MFVKLKPHLVYVIKKQPLFLQIVQEMIAELTLTERIETLVPLTYILCYAIAYYGPNAEILGNIQNDYWQYESIDDIWKVVQNVLVMFVVDGCSAVIVGIILWRVCSIRILQEARKLIAHSWPIIVVNIANYLNYVSFSVIIIILNLPFI